MALILTLALAATICFASAQQNFADIVSMVNADQESTWTAEVPARFNSTEDAKRLCGTYLKDHPDYEKLPELKEVDAEHHAELEALIEAGAVPDSFDSRTQWPKCSVIARINDQSDCGSCWAFGSTESFSDRHCAQTGKDINFAVADTTSCCHAGLSMGCNGGQPSGAWNWFTTIGVVTGGSYEEDLGCLDYTLPPCAHHVPPSPKYKACPQQEYPTPQCTRECRSNYTVHAYGADKTKASKSFSLPGVKYIQAAIMAKGPVAAAFTVYSDFPTYKSGVYKHKTNQELGGHAIEIIGWGTEDSQDYWLVKNSWNEEWGDQGFFKILRGSDECGIEDDVSGGNF